MPEAVVRMLCFNCLFSADVDNPLIIKYGSLLNYIKSFGYQPDVNTVQAAAKLLRI
jgi:hypothetical protein